MTWSFEKIRHKELSRVKTKNQLRQLEVADSSLSADFRQALSGQARASLETRDITPKLDPAIPASHVTYIAPRKDKGKAIVRRDLELTPPLTTNNDDDENEPWPEYNQTAFEQLNKTGESSRTQDMVGILDLSKLTIVAAENKKRKSPIQQQSKSCNVCLEDFSDEGIERPSYPPTTWCTHPPNTCHACLVQSINFDINNSSDNKIWCPDCNTDFEPHEIQMWVDEETMERYSRLCTLRLLQKMDKDNFVTCAYTDCTSGQIHEGGEAAPHVVCVGCNRAFCFNHNIPWAEHEDYTCDEWNHRAERKSAWELASEQYQAAKEAREAAEEDEAQRRDIALREAAVAAAADKEQAHRDLQTARDKAQSQRERRERRHRERKAGREREREERNKEIRERQKENAEGEQTKKLISKNCPACGVPTWKDAGCNWMECRNKVGPGVSDLCFAQWCFKCGYQYTNPVNSHGNLEKCYCIKTDYDASMERQRMHWMGHGMTFIAPPNFGGGGQQPFRGRQARGDGRLGGGF